MGRGKGRRRGGGRGGWWWVVVCVGEREGGGGAEGGERERCLDPNNLAVRTHQKSWWLDADRCGVRGATL